MENLNLIPRRVILNSWYWIFNVINFSFAWDANQQLRPELCFCENESHLMQGSPVSTIDWDIWDLFITFTIDEACNFQLAQIAFFIGENLEIVFYKVLKVSLVVQFTKLKKAVVLPLLIFALYENAFLRHSVDKNAVGLSITSDSKFVLGFLPIRIVDLASVEGRLRIADRKVRNLFIFVSDFAIDHQIVLHVCTNEVTWVFFE